MWGIVTDQLNGWTIVKVDVKESVTAELASRFKVMLQREVDLLFWWRLKIISEAGE